MSNNIFSSNDDYLFEDYQETTTETYQEEPVVSEDNIDKVFADIDSPFRTLLTSSSLKVNFGDAFYNAAHEWIHQGYREANSASILDALVSLTDGKFLYHHRMTTSFEILNRKKTIIRFLNLILNDPNAENIVKVAGQESDIHLSETYFNMFFRSFYNIQIHTYYCELAVYMSLCDMLELEHDQDLLDPLCENNLNIIDTADHINNLYMKHFDGKDLSSRIKDYVDDFFAFKEKE